MKKTINLQLNKPELMDYVNVEDLNANSDLIDTAVQVEKERIDNHLEDNVRHITATERTKWNGKQDALSNEQKRKIYIQTTQPASPQDGDIWIEV